MRRIRHVRVAIGERQLLALDQRVDEVGGGLSVRGDVEPVQHLEHLQQRHALAVGRQLVDLHVAVVDAQRVDPFGAVGGEVVRGQPTPTLGEEFQDSAAERPRVHERRTLSRDLFERVGQVGFA